MGKAEYFLFNAINNAFPYSRIDPGLSVRRFVRDDPGAQRSSLPQGSSPSRTLSDLFWAALPWSAIQTELGGVRILDVGCGNGAYGPRLLAWSADRIDSYTGTDARRRDEWAALEARDGRLHFFQSDAADFRARIPAGTNVFMSQSAIEHFDEDITFFQQIRDYVQSTRGPVLQVHLVPSQACLRLYHLHGVRQYTPRTLSRITRLFAPDAYSVLYGLGGAASNRVHYRFITRPLLIERRGDGRLEQPEAYERALWRAIEADMAQPQSSPAFWALVIHSRCRHRIFDGAVNASPGGRRR